MILGNVPPVSFSGLAVVPDGPNQNEDVAGGGLHYDGQTDPSDEFPQPVGAGYEAEAIVLQDGEAGNAGHEVRSSCSAP